ncbi:AcrR family transcriptional regulator [Leifsonia sp. AK011]|uniref:TetR/AcrR family transcriptional regulator n=1 Tax=Leifsonia sp. AK011 TaxID=2723075 RepID=UPI0015C8081A|nr:TetR/AcrR family transcriptional regulator [Leifsonia sp. AK011]NYF11471.1 AcrR family transcriptional regulator [Leifsonia sp. AK011]
MSTSQDDLRAIALAEFASAGYVGTSLQRIAELAGLSKSSVLYHYGSKEQLLEAAIGPAVDRMEEILVPLNAVGLAAANRQEFLEEFVDFLLQYRLEVHMFINQGPALVDVPVIDRANAVIVRLAEFFSTHTSSVEEKARFGVALGGAAYMLSTARNLGLDAPPIDETRAALVTILSELLTPVRIP